MKDFLIAVVFGGLFAVLALPLYVENDFFFPFITGKNFAFRIIVEIVFAAWVLLALFDKQYRPKFSWLLPTFGGLLVVMLFANALGEYPLKSFMSNFERMDGYVTLVHVFLYTLVLGSVMTTKKMWGYFAHFSLAVATWVALYGLGQQADIFAGGRGSRVDSTLGNAAYMAVYMLFHTFLVFYLSLVNKNNTARIIYALLGLIFLYTLLQTGTRGTFLGLVGGAGVMVSYVALFGRREPVLRKFAIGGIAVLVLLAGSFYVARDSHVIQNSGPLSRIANIDLQEDLEVRMTIWSLAYEGVQERPVLGWGQGNFNYVFNEHYEAELWDQEQWFDRVHNIFFDWLIAGGVLGFIAYFSIMGAVIYYCFVVPVILRRQSPFTVPEQATLLGLLVAYLLHNFVVFDNIISYIFYGSMLGYIHYKVARPIGAVERFRISDRMVTQFVTPLVIIATGFTIYATNVPGIQASGDIIDAITSNTIRERLEEFHSALERDSFARQEIVEQLAQQAIRIANNQQIPQEDKQMIIQRAELELLDLIADKPGDARIHNFTASFYRTIGAIPEAREQAALAREYSPDKPALIVEQALVELQGNQLAAARDFLAEAYELAPENPTTVIFYGAVLFRLGEVEQAETVVGEDFKEAFALNDYAIASVESAEAFGYLRELFTIRVAEQPDNPQNRASLAFLQYQTGDTEAAIATLRQAGEDIPSFAERANCYASNLEAGREPTATCTPAE